MRAVEAAQGAGHADVPGQFVGREPAVVVVVQALGVEVVEVVAQAGFLLRVAGRAVEHAALAVVAVDALAGEHLGHLVGDAVEQVPAGAALFTGQAGQGAVLAQQIAHQPAAVAPAGAEAGDFRFQHHHLQFGGLALEVVGGPQAGVAGADDGDVGLQAAAQGRAGREGLVELVHPQADRFPGRHGHSSGLKGSWAASLVAAGRLVVRAGTPTRQRDAQPSACRRLR